MGTDAARERPLDAAHEDAGLDAAAASDSGASDSGALDGGALDGGAADSGVPDAWPHDTPTLVDAPLDAAPLDAATHDAYASPDAASFDVGLDAWRADLGPVQCSAALECPIGPGLCSDTTPGGVCSCFVDAESCPVGTTCDTAVSACVRACGTDLDCSAGMQCNTTLGRCELIRCDAAASCPAPYVCSRTGGAGVCVRPRCHDSPCPAPLSCVGDVCVEG